MLNRFVAVTRALVSSTRLFLVLASLCFIVTAQTSSATDGSTPLGLQPGAPAGSYALSDFDNVNLFNGNLSFQLSLLGVSGRGSAQIPVLLPIEGKWRVLDLAIPQADGSFQHHYLPMQSWWENNDRKYRPGSLIARQGNLDQITCPDNTEVYAVTLTRLTFTSPDGTEYELRDQLTGGQPSSGAACNYLNPPSRGTVFVTSDGSAATFVSDATIYDQVIAPNSSETYPSGYLMLRDGTRFRIETGNVVWMRDRNGNKLTFGYDSNNRVQTITDSLNRVVTISRNTGPGTFDQITYKGFGGAQRIVKVNYSSLASALRSDYANTLTYKTLFPELDGSSTSYHNPSVVSSITLPNNQQYIIKYNPYGEIARVVLPTGGAIEYDYAAGASANASGAFAGGYEGSWVVYRRVVERRVFPDGGTGAAYANRMTYSRTEAECAGCVKADQLDNSGVLLARSKHYFYGNAATSFAIGPTDYPGWQEGREYQTEEYANDGTTILRRTVNTWQQPTAGTSWPLTQAETNVSTKTNNPQITQTTVSLEPGQADKVSKQTFAYDKYTNRTSIYEYDFGNGSPGSLVRRTQTNYLTSSYDTLNPSSSNPDLNLTSHIRNLPAQVSVFDATGIERARTATEYDNYTLDGLDCQHSFHCPLLSRSNISGFDSLIGSSYTMRGNATSSTHFLLSNGSVTGSVSTYTQYDVAGNVVRVLDPRSTVSNNIATTIEYDDRFGTPNNEARSNTAPSELLGLTSFAFPTRVINPLGHTSCAQFDYYLGRPVNGEDANGSIASGWFNDSLDRPTQIRRGIGTGAENQTTFAYDDLTRVVTTSSDRDMADDNLLVSKVFYDLMGRTIETRQYEGGSNFIATQTQYDALGRAFKISNPFRTWQSESAVWTTQGFDALGRLISVTTPDNAVVSTSYEGNSVIVTDQAGKRRKSVTDALGRLTDVWEDPQPQNPSGLNYQTTYNYDVLDNLVKVTQGSQQRFFVYDSLRRLLRSRNPEQGTLASLNLSDPITGNSAWSIAYQYDVSGNLTQKTDARGTVSNYAYDSLNRNTTIDYSDTAFNPDVKRFYDGATNGAGRFWYSYKGGDYTTGSNVEHAAIDSYDALGRPLVQRQLFKLNDVWSGAYQTSRTYNRAGAVASQTYPSGHSVSYVYDYAGRTTNFTGNLGDGTQRTYATGITYSSWGSLGREQFGTNAVVYHKIHYNIRGQLCDVRASNVNDEWGAELGALVNYYSTTWTQCGSGSDNNGNVLMSQTIVSSYYLEDRHSYDTLNRLTSVSEYQNGATLTGTQQYSYDRWGNRTIDPASTVGFNRQFTVDPATNRLGVPGGQPGVMSYDAAGNLITDTYTGAGIRTYDAENRMTTAADNTGQISRYTYDADGRRARVQVASSQEKWHVYGFDGELLAEYQSSSPATAPEKEYGYRNGQLLVTATGRFNVALAANGAIATASSTHTCCGFSTTGAINGNNRGPWGNGEGWNDATPNSVPDWIQVDFAGSKTIDEIDVFSLHDNYTTANTPTETQTFTLYGLLAFDVQYWNGSSWVTVPGGSVTGNNNVWRRFTFTPITTSKIRVWINAVVDSWSRVVEIQAFGTSAGGEKIQWLVQDHLGTPRMIIDQSGALANVKRHDYLPFGEELFAGTGGRTSSLGYTSGDGIRQQFTAKERDIETGLDYFGARYYSSAQGRFTSIDPILLSDHRLADPQQLNLYVYTRNDPLNLLDPTGETIDFEKDKNGNLTDAGRESQEQYEKYKDFLNNDPKKYASQLATLKQLEESDVNYVVDVTSKGFEGDEAEGRTSTDGTNVLLTIRNIGDERISMAARFAHEFEHARQFDDGEFHFIRTASGKWGPDPQTYDIFDEVKAFKAQLGVSVPIHDSTTLRSLRDSRSTDAERANTLRSSYPGRNPTETNVNFLWNEPKGTLVRPNAKHPDVFGRVHQ